MKVCFILPSVPHYRKTLFEALAENSLINELSVLGGSGFSVKIIKDIDSANGYVILRQALYSIGVGKINLKWQQGLLLRLFHDRPTHVIMLYHMSIVNQIFVPVLCRLLGIKVFFWGSGSGEDVKIRGRSMSKAIVFKLWFKSRFYGLFDGILVYSKKHQLRLIASGVQNEIRVAQNTCQTEHLLDIPIRAARSNRFLFVGALEGVKKLDLLLNALSKVNNRQWSLDIIGEGSKRENLEALASSLDIDKMVSFHGAKYERENLYFWQNADYVVLPGVGGLLINEAMAAGKYILATSGDGTGEDLLACDDILVHDIDEKTLKDRIENLLLLSNENYSMKCDRNRKFAQNYLRIEHMEKSIIEMLVNGKT